MTVTTGMNLCFSALQTITVGGSNGPFTVNAGGVVTMIAGQNILYLPGTKVWSGGYMHGLITTDNTWCGQQQPSIPINNNEEENSIVSETNTDFFKVYPNPTHGKFTVELSVGEETADAVVWVYGMMGGLVLEKSMMGVAKKEFSLESNPGGIYIVKVLKSDKIGTVKIIRQQ